MADQEIALVNSTIQFAQLPTVNLEDPPTGHWRFQVQSGSWATNAGLPRVALGWVDSERWTAQSGYQEFHAAMLPPEIWGRRLTSGGWSVWQQIL